jgi:itaconyl-CoA hydratase
MEKTPSAYRQLGPKRYRETSGLYHEDFEIGDVFEHRPGRTITDVDNIWMTLLTMNVQPVHFDAAYAAKTEWKKMLVDSTFTLALLTGMSVRTVSAKVVANLGWDKVKATHPVFAGDTLYAESTDCRSASRKSAYAGDRYRFNSRIEPGRQRSDELRARRKIHFALWLHPPAGYFPQGDSLPGFEPG